MRKLVHLAGVVLLASPVTGCGAELLIAIATTSTDRPTFCKMTSGEVYRRDADCDAIDQEIDFAEYTQIYRNNADAETRKVIAANEAARNAKVHCLTALSETPYIAASGRCQQSDLSISESEYRSRKSSQANDLGTPPVQPIASGGATAAGPPTQSAAVAPTTPEQAAVNPEPEIATPSSPTGLARIPDSAKAVSSGTAFFVAEQGRLLTNRHVVEGCDWIGLMAESGLHTAVKIAESRSLDLAMLKTDFQGDGIAVFADEQPEIGEDSYVAGFPLLDKLWSLNFTNGIISSRAPFGDPNLLQTTAAVQHGNSGGPMFDASGHVIGVVVARLADKTAQNVNFAIKSDAATDFIGQSGVTPKIAARSADLKASRIAKSAQAIVVPTICFKKG
jgi:S1-C subfamily serine protease